MINVIAGPRGNGKTNKIISKANDASEITKGNIVFITDTGDISRDVKNSIRFINVAEYGKITEEYLLGFIDGIFASNSDITALYIDGLVRLLGTKPEDLEEFFIALETISERSHANIIVTVTCDKPPKFMKKYL